MIRNLTKNTIIAGNTRNAVSFRDRLCGLIGRQFGPELEGMIFSSCNAIHTVFMGFPIDVIFADREKKVLKQLEFFPPFRLFLGCRKACWTLELPAGTLRKSGTAPGDILDF